MNIVRKGTTQVVQQNKHENEMEYLTFPSITATGIVSHAFSTRIGGASKGYFGEANYSFTRGDVREDVEENYMRMAQILGYGRSLEHFVTTFQTHTSNVRVITADDMGKGVIKERDYVDVDGMITNIPGIILTTFHADCPPIYFVDPVKRAIGLSHSGWKGTGIVVNAINLMKEKFGSEPENILTGISACIHDCCYIVTEDRAEYFRKNFGEDCIKPLENKTEEEMKAIRSWNGLTGPLFRLSLVEANLQLLKNAGIQEGNIAVLDECTSCNSAFGSNRRETSEGSTFTVQAAFVRF